MKCVSVKKLMNGRSTKVSSRKSATMPSAMFFRDDDESRFFLATGIAETAVTALTDFSSGSESSSRYIRRAA